MKGITPIIATIILLLITIGLASAAYTYIAGYWSGAASSVLELVDQYCNGSKDVGIALRNVGTSTIYVYDITVISVDGHKITHSWANNAGPGATTIEPQSTVIFTDDIDSAAPCSNGICSYRFISRSGPAVQVTVPCK